MHTWISCRAMVFGAVLGASLVVLAQPSSSAAVSLQEAQTAQCRPAGPLIRIPELPEASGLAVSQRVPGRLWSHNDSGQATLFALDARGSVTARVSVTGAAVGDWEAIAVGPCAGGSCLFIADIGDNAAKRPGVIIYRIAEPAANETSVAVAGVINLTYPDGAHDAESLLVTKDGDILIVTKGETGPVGVYRVPANARASGTAQLERVGAAIQGKAAPEQRITDGTVSSDGRWVVLRTRASLVFYRTADFVKGEWREARRVDLTPLGEPQGEGVALGAGNAVYVAGEGGGKKQPGTLARFTCEPES